MGKDGMWWDAYLVYLGDSALDHDVRRVPALSAYYLLLTTDYVPGDSALDHDVRRVPVLGVGDDFIAGIRRGAKGVYATGVQHVDMLPGRAYSMSSE